MQPSQPSLSSRVASFLSVNKLKIFHQNGDYVALFGEPPMADDGWIINLPATHVFAGDYHSLPFDVELQATWAHAQSTVRQPLATYISFTSPGESWDTKVAALGMPAYEPADLFRDFSSILINQNQPVLALSFINAAHQLRPGGPIIRQMLNSLTQQLAPLNS